jgi:hypothetical protein
MHPRTSDILGAGVFALLLFGLVALVVALTWANADPESHAWLVRHVA